MQYITEITPDMTRRVDELLASNFKDATVEDIELYANWKSAIAMQKEAYRQARELEKEEIKAQIEKANAEKDKAIELFDLEIEAAKARLKAVENG